MSVSLPSREVYVVDVPEPERFEAAFRYNFFTPDERVSDTGGVPANVLERKADEVDAQFVQYASARAPRAVVMTWKLPRLVESGGRVDDVSQRSRSLSTHAQRSQLISNNLDKIVSEDRFSRGAFVGITFNDAEVDDKLHEIVSGSYAVHALARGDLGSLSHNKAARELSSVAPPDVDPEVLARAMTQPSRAHGTRYKNAGRRVVNAHYKRLKAVSSSGQINAKFLYDLTRRSIADPGSQYDSELVNLQRLAQRGQSRARQAGTAVSEDDYKTRVPFVDIRMRSTAPGAEERAAHVVGYIIDKAEVGRDGTFTPLSPLIIDNPRVSMTADFRVKYGAMYAYSVRTIVMLAVPAINDDTDEVAMLKVLVSSRPTPRVYVEAIEVASPPSPADLNFRWDYHRINPTTAAHDPQTGMPVPGSGRRGSMMVHWTFPPNPQRDIKRFQVFRRSNIAAPFELVKEINFDDSAVPTPDRENPSEALVERLAAPRTFFYDDDFTPDAADRGRFIYAVTSIDAHGYTSGYSAQFEVWFDRFKNTVVKRLVSHAGAPKQYPNLYLEADTFVDTIRASGPSSRRLRVYFNPEHYAVIDDSGRVRPVVATRQAGSSYVLQFINVDNQKACSISMSVDDRSNAVGTLGPRAGAGRQERASRLLAGTEQ